MFETDCLTNVSNCQEFYKDFLQGSFQLKYQLKKQLWKHAYPFAHLRQDHHKEFL